MGGEEAVGRKQGGAWSQLGHPWLWIKKLTSPWSCPHCLSFLALEDSQPHGSGKTSRELGLHSDPITLGVWLMLFIRGAEGFSSDWDGEQKPGKRPRLGMRDCPDFLLYRWAPGRALCHHGFGPW